LAHSKPAAFPLLTTKLYVPSPRPNLVSRSHLLERLDRGLRLGRRLTLVSAPAGFGKTTLVAEWLRGGVPSLRFAFTVRLRSQTCLAIAGPGGQ
jgi:LuxR family maltose regulon positive regulatory protein